MNLIDTMKNTRLPSPRPAAVATALALLTLLASPSIRAQAVAPAKPAPETEKEKAANKDIVELTPFTLVAAPLGRHGERAATGRLSGAWVPTLSFPAV